MITTVLKENVKQEDTKDYHQIDIFRNNVQPRSSAITLSHRIYHKIAFVSEGSGCWSKK